MVYRLSKGNDNLCDRETGPEFSNRMGGGYWEAIDRSQRKSNIDATIAAGYGLMASESEREGPD